MCIIPIKVKRKGRKQKFQWLSFFCWIQCQVYLPDYGNCIVNMMHLSFNRRASVVPSSAYLAKTGITKHHGRSYPGTKIPEFRITVQPFCGHCHNIPELVLSLDHYQIISLHHNRECFFQFWHHHMTVLVDRSLLNRTKSTGHIFISQKLAPQHNIFSIFLFFFPLSLVTKFVC